jgi:predicted CXXCH cytochrome family protein
MNREHKIIFSLIAILIAFATMKAYGEDKNRLKLGASGKICLTCHVQFEEKMKAPFVHTPLKKGDCVGCHNPHASSHGKLLAAAANRVCAKCHGTMIPKNALSVHKDVASGNCTKCHDPHAANNKFNLLKGGKDLCFGCHKEMGETVTKARFRHNPVEKDCTACHSPHASVKSKYLLVETVPTLCLKCHRSDNPTFVKLHMNYPVAKGDCTSCHNTHGSEKGALLYTNVHVPVANRLCNQCHEDPTSATPFKTKKKGFELCRGCHNDMINETFSKSIIHWSLLGEEGCVSCHAPHGSKQPKLLKGTLGVVCGKCHADTMERLEKSPTKHKPIQEGNCTACHAPHSSDFSYLGNKPIIELCGSCHNWKEHTTHPLGDKVVDKRNSGLRVDCLSCHRSHGTEYKKLIPFKTPSDLCLQCHKEVKP